LSGPKEEGRTGCPGESSFSRLLRCDLLVIGAGPSGSACATTAARAGLDVLLVDKSSFPRDKLCGDFLAPGAVERLKRLGIDEQKFSLSPTILKGTRLCYGGHDIWMPFPATRPGWAVARRDLDNELLLLAGCAGARILERCRITSVKSHPDKVVAGGTMASGSGLRIDAAFVVDAGGRNALLPRRLGWRRPSRWPLRLSLGAWYDGVKGMSDRVEMHVLAQGYVGIAPLPGGLAGVAAVFPAEAPGHSTLDHAAFLLAAVQGSPELRGRFTDAHAVTATRGAGPLAHGAARLAGGRILLAGDAVAFVDPFTGEGVQAALTGGVTAALAVVEALAIQSTRAGGDAIGMSTMNTPLPLRSYARSSRRRQRPRLMMARAIQALLCSRMLAEPVARSLANRSDLAGALAEVTGGLREPSALMASPFPFRLAREILFGRRGRQGIGKRELPARKPIRKPAS
jgi:flavin-dependent dehydrogenase